MLVIGKIHVYGVFLHVLLHFLIGNRGFGGLPTFPSPTAFTPPSRAGKPSFIPARASPACACIGCRHSAWQDGAWGADGHGGLPMGCASCAYRGSGGHHTESNKEMSPHTLMAASASFSSSLGSQLKRTPQITDSMHPGPTSPPSPPPPPILFFPQAGKLLLMSACCNPQVTTIPTPNPTTFGVFSLHPHGVGALFSPLTPS